ncbi:MAG: ABC transporter permease [Firmicutes bacterium]|nr:ABC transporter permease [Bacillota bacterium]
MSMFLKYTTKHYDKLLNALAEHLQIVGITLVISVSLAMLVSVFLMNRKKLAETVVGAWNVVYTIPSLALFALLIPVTGLGKITAVLVLVLYNQFILVRAFTDGLMRVDESVIESATGMGMTQAQIFVRVRFPLALDSIVAGIRIAIVSTIGIATVAATIGAGGLGSLLFDGMRTQNPVKMIWGTILCAGLVLMANLILKVIENRVRTIVHC